MGDWECFVCDRCINDNWEYSEHHDEYVCVSCFDEEGDEYNDECVEACVDWGQRCPRCDRFEGTGCECTECGATNAFYCYGCDTLQCHCCMETVCADCEYPIGGEQAVVLYDDDNYHCYDCVTWCSDCGGSAVPTRITAKNNRFWDGTSVHDGGFYCAGCTGAYEAYDEYEEDEEGFASAHPPRRELTSAGEEGAARNRADKAALAAAYPDFCAHHLLMHHVRGRSVEHGCTFGDASGCRNGAHFRPSTLDTKLPSLHLACRALE